MSRWENKYVIGLTGNIAVGKSVVRQMLQHLGAYTLDADGLSHQAMMPGAPAYKPVIETFGKFMLNEDGLIDRARLGSVVFAMPDALTALETIVHPVVHQALIALVGRAKQRVVVIEAIKLVETDLADMVDAIWVVDASPEAQLKRLTDKRKMSDDEARKRIFAQRPQAEKIARADVIITNEDNVEETWKQVQIGWNGVRKALGESVPAAPPPTPQASAQPSAAPRPAQPATPTPASTPQVQQNSLPPIPRQGQPGAPVSAQPSVTPMNTSNSLMDPKTAIIVRRGMPGNAEAIASFVSQVAHKDVGRMDIMLAFGQKSYHIAYGKNDQVISVIGWTVENLITRVDEFYISPNVPKNEIIHELSGAIEDASRELQSEVSFVVLPIDTTPEITQAFIKSGYQFLKLSEVKFPAWREAAHEMMSDSNVQALMKQLRADRVMKPI
ncbi:MAG: dephospho-CoA kinase [Chloroflexi bacterium]|nr:dephospho-CoA kinase [Chloroflexota bacterium]